MIAGDGLRIADAEGVREVIVDDERRRNPLSLRMLAAIEETFNPRHAPADLKVVVIRGAGLRSFAAGGDLVELEGLRDHAAALAVAEAGTRALDAVRRFPVPVVALLNGDALGGGAELAMACDLRIAAPWARIGFLQASLNIVAGWGGERDLIRVLGPSAALRALAEVRLLDAAAALAGGWIDDVLATDANADRETALRHAVYAWLAPYRQRPPQVLRALKASVRSSTATADETRSSREHFTRTWLHADHWAASQALLAKLRST